MPSSLSHLTDLLERYEGPSALVRSVHRRQALLAQVRKALPSPLASHCVAAGLSGDRLILFADSPAWGSRLRFLAPGLITALAKAGTAARDARVRVLIPENAPRQRPRPRPTLSSANAGLLAQVAQDITDPALREAIKRLARWGG